jgi:exodeoxyribonuclease VIII
MIMQNPTAKAILNNNTGIEMSGFWKSKHHDFDCKLRTDIINDDIFVIADYKTTTDASPEGFSRHFFNYGYDVQAAWYLQGIKEIKYQQYEFVIIAQEKEPPYAVGCFRVPEEVLEIGRIKIAWVSQKIEECIAKDKWPSYPELSLIKVQAWAKYEADMIKEELQEDEKTNNNQGEKNNE